MKISVDLLIAFAIVSGGIALICLATFFIINRSSPVRLHRNVQNKEIIIRAQRILDRFFDHFDSHASRLIFYMSREGNEALYKLRQLQLIVSELCDQSNKELPPYVEVNNSLEDENPTKILILDLEQPISNLIAEAADSLTLRDKASLAASLYA